MHLSWGSVLVVNGGAKKRCWDVQRGVEGNEYVQQGFTTFKKASRNRSFETPASFFKSGSISNADLKKGGCKRRLRSEPAFDPPFLG